MSNRTEGKRMKVQAKQRSGLKTPPTWWGARKRDRKEYRRARWRDWIRASRVARWIERKFGWSWRWLRRIGRMFKRKKRS